MDKIEVTGCKDCPFLRPTNDGEYYRCEIKIGKSPVIDHEDFEPITPDWCPLKNKSLTISLKHQ